MSSSSQDRSIGRRIFTFSVYALAFSCPLSMAATQIAAGLVILLGLWLILSRERSSSPPLWETIFLSSLIFLVLISSALSIDPQAALPQLRKSWVLIGFFPLAMFSSFYSKRTITLLLIWATVLASLIGAARYLSGMIDRAAPFSGGYTTLALFEAAMLPFAIVFLWETKARHRWLYLIAVMSMTAGLVMTGVRSGWLGALLGVVIVGMAVNKRLTVIAVLGVATIAVVVPQSRLSIFNRYEIEKRGGMTSGRLILWSAAREPLTHMPFFGHGPGSFTRLIPREALEATGDSGIKSWHSTPLDVLLESGPLALVSLLGLAIMTLRKSWRSYTRAPALGWLDLAIFSSLIALYFASLTTNLLRDFMLMTLLVVLWTCAIEGRPINEAAGE